MSIESDGQQTPSIKPLGQDHTPGMENVCWIVGTLLYVTVVAIWVYGLVHATRARRWVWFVLVLVGVMPSWLNLAVHHRPTVQFDPTPAVHRFANSSAPNPF